MSRAHKILPSAVFSMAMAAALPSFAQNITAPKNQAPTDLEPPAPPPWPNAKPLGVPKASSPAPAEEADPRILLLEKRLATLEEQVRRAHEEEKVRAQSEGERRDRELVGWIGKFRLSGYVQPQMVWQWFNAAASPNQVNGSLPGGIGANDVTARAADPYGNPLTTNTSYFRLRRARLRTEFLPTSGVRLVFEIDPAGVEEPGGHTVLTRNVEAIGTVHWPAGGSVTTDFGMGIFRLPFGSELLEQETMRSFVETTWSMQNLFPGQYDTGARAYTSFFEQALHVQLALVNGQTLGERSFSILPDLNKGKDILGRVAYDFGIATVGVSGYYGQGQVVDSGTVLRFKQFPRWAYNAELGIKHRFFPALGTTRLRAEITRAKNLDRGVYYGRLALPSFPPDISRDVEDVDELGYWLSLEQDLSRHITLAGRYDYYCPNTGVATNGRDTLSASVAYHMSRNLHARLEFDHAVDNVHSPGENAPEKKIETLSAMMQAQF